MCSPGSGRFWPIVCFYLIYPAGVWAEPGSAPRCCWRWTSASVRRAEGSSSSTRRRRTGRSPGRGRRCGPSPPQSDWPQWRTPPTGTGPAHCLPDNTEGKTVTAQKRLNPRERKNHGGEQSEDDWRYRRVPQERTEEAWQETGCSASDWFFFSQGIAGNTLIGCKQSVCAQLVVWLFYLPFKLWTQF